MDNSMEERLVSPEELNSDDLKKRVWKEFGKLWGIAFPGTVARLTSFGMIVVTQLFMGHVSELDLAAFGLQQSILIRFVNGILVRPPLNMLIALSKIKKVFKNCILKFFFRKSIKIIFFLFFKIYFSYQHIKMIKKH
jgi:MATE family multidrug resistance protein